MEKNQIQVENVKTGSPSIFTIKGDKVFDSRGKNPVYCSCTGNTVKTATPMKYSEKEGVYCPHCHEKKVEITKTYDEWKAEKEEFERKMNEERLANLHLTEAGSDWECGFKYYCLSAQIDYDDWLKVKKHFRYYRRGWSRGQELEWNYGEPTGWLTQDPQAVEEILVEAGLIKPENTMAEIEHRAELAKQQKEAKRKEAMAKREQIKEKMDVLDEQIKEAFNSKKVKSLDDAEATHYYRGDYGKGTICRYTITDTEIIKCVNMGDFTYAVAIPYSKDVEKLIKDFYKLNDEFWECLRS